MNLQIPYTFAPWGGFRIAAAWLDTNFSYLLNLISSLGPVPVVSYQASETIAAGALINIWDNGGVAQVRNANGTSGYVAHGFSQAAIAALATAPVTLNGIVSGLAGLTPGAPMFLGPTAGSMSATPPASGSGLYLQTIGFAAGTGTVYFFGGPLNGPM